MPRWLGPWVIPIALIIGVLAGAAASSAGMVGDGLISFVLLLLLVGVLVWRRLRYLRENPPDPELTHKPFWRW